MNKIERILGCLLEFNVSFHPVPSSIVDLSIDIFFYNLVKTSLIQMEVADGGTTRR